METTNEEDQREVAKLQARLRENASTSNTPHDTSMMQHRHQQQEQEQHRISNVTLADGTHKYVLMSAIIPEGNERQNFVVSRTNASYHRNVAEPMIEQLEESGYSCIAVLGGGRISYDTINKKISIYGFSYGFGLADHALSKSVIDNDPRYKDYSVTWSNDGY